MPAISNKPYNQASQLIPLIHKFMTAVRELDAIQETINQAGVDFSLITSGDLDNLGYDISTYGPADFDNEVRNFLAYNSDIKQNNNNNMYSLGIRLDTAG